MIPCFVEIKKFYGIGKELKKVKNLFNGFDGTIFILQHIGKSIAINVNDIVKKYFFIELKDKLFCINNNQNAF